MDREAYEAFTGALLSRVSVCPDVVGLVAVGSMSGIPPGPDRFSDHDFFLVVESGAQEKYRAAPSWLPDPERIVLWHRETAHGLKAVWDDGHLAELAVFDVGELKLARVNRYRVLLNRAEVGNQLEAVRADTVERTSPVDARYECGQLLATLLVGGLRAARGERISAGFLIRGVALRHFSSLLAVAVPARAGARLDDLDPLRRMELGWPEVASVLDGALSRPPLPAARSLLALADATFRDRPAVPWPALAANAVSRVLGREADEELSGHA